MEKEIKIVPPEGYDIDQEHSTFECIKFRPIVAKKWKDNKSATIRGFYIDADSNIYSHEGANNFYNHNMFATKKQAKSALAMARISQIMANDERFGGVVTDKEWMKHGITKWTIERSENKILTTIRHFTYTFLAFHTAEQCNLFLAENIDLIKDYLMLD